MRTTPRAAVLVSLALAESAAAQPRRAPPAGCAVVHHTLATVDGEGVDAGAAPLVARVGEAALAAWRTRGGALRLAAFDAAWRPVGGVRELAREAGAFALAEGPTGAAVVYVERGRELTLARVNARGEAQNVPRLLHRAEGPLREVAVARVDAGWLVVWRDDLRQAHALPLDARGAPRGLANALGAGRSLRLAWLRSQGVAALVLEGAAGDEPALVSVSAGGDVIARLRWPAATAGPFELPAGLAAAQLTAAGAPTLLRVPPAGSTLAPPEGAARARYDLLAAAPDEGGVTMVYHDAAAGRTLASRVGESGVAASPAAVRVGPAEPVGLAVWPDGSVVVTHREPGAHGGARVVATRVTCRR